MRDYMGFLSFWDWLNPPNVIISSCNRFPESMSWFIVWRNSSVVCAPPAVSFSVTLLLDIHVGSRV